MSTNITTISGNVGQDPKIRTTTGGLLIGEISLASNQYRLGQDGQKQTVTSWIPVKGFGKVAERLQNQVTKGTRLIVVGRLQEETWTDKQTNQKRSRLVVVAESFELIGGAKAPAEKAQSEVVQSAAQAVGQDYQEEDSIPF
jgi:single-strand DNA-binding protein